MGHKYKCPCCSSRSLDSKNSLDYEICSICFWENDPIQNDDPEYAGGANSVSLNQAKQNFQKYGVSQKKFLEYKNELTKAPFRK